MSYSNDISNLLNLKDKNIFFKDSCVSEERINKVIVKVFNGVLTYTPSKCPKCGHEQDGQIIMGSRQHALNCQLFRALPLIYALKRGGVSSQDCGQTFTLKTTIVQKHCSISNLTKIAIAIDLK